MLAAQLPMSRAGACRLADRRRRHAERRGRQSARCSSSIGRTAPSRIVAHRAEMGNGVAHRLPHDRRRRARSRLGARARRAGARRRGKTYGNQDTDGSRSMRHFIQPMRQCGAPRAHDAGEPPPPKWSVPAAEVKAQSRGRAQADRPQARLRRAGRRGRGEPVPSVDRIKLKDPSDFRYIGKGKVQHRRPRRHHHRQGASTARTSCCPA